MYSDTQLKIWRIINSVLLATGMLLPWYQIFSIEGDVFPMPAGWKTTYQHIVRALENIKSFDDPWYPIMIILTGVGVVLVFLYLAYNMLTITKKRNAQCKLLSFVFVGVNILFLNESTGGARQRVAGFWVISAGLLSSAVFEWVNARSVDAQVVE